MKYLALSSLLTALCASASAQFTQERRISENEPYVVRQEMHLSVTDASTMELVNADVLIKGLNPRKTVVFEAVADTSFEIKNYRLYTVSCVEKGFMYYRIFQWLFSEPIDYPPPGQSDNVIGSDDVPARQPKDYKAQRHTHGALRI